MACPYNLLARNPFAPPPVASWLQPEKQAENVGRKLKPDGRSQDALKHAKSCKLRSFEHPPPRAPPPAPYIGFLRVLPIPSCLFLSLSLQEFHPFTFPFVLPLVSSLLPNDFSTLFAVLPLHIDSVASRTLVSPFFVHGPS